MACCDLNIAAVAAVGLGDGAKQERHRRSLTALGRAVVERLLAAADLLYRRAEEDSFELIAENDFRDELNPQLFTYDNKDLYVMSNLGRDKLALYRYDLANPDRILERYLDHHAALAAPLFI